MGGVDLSEMVQDVLVVCVVGLNFCEREAGYITLCFIRQGSRCEHERALSPRLLDHQY